MASDNFCKLLCFVLIRFIPGSLVELKTDHFRWEGWCDFAYKNQLVLVGWDHNVQPPGPDFSWRGAGAVTTRQWGSLVKRINWRGNPFFDPDLPELDVQQWDGG